VTDPVSDTPLTQQRLHVLVFGRVQGVGFRAFVLTNASALGIKGWCRNVGWDRVEVVAEGSRAAMNTLLEMLQRGPSMAIVEIVQTEWLPATGEFTQFRVR
jgi:acylphosphatase